MQHTRGESRLPDCDFRYFHFIPPILCHNAVHKYPSFPRLKSPPPHLSCRDWTGKLSSTQIHFNRPRSPLSNLLWGHHLPRPSVIGGLPRPPLRALFSPPPSREETKERHERSYPPSLLPSFSSPKLAPFLLLPLRVETKRLPRNDLIENYASAQKMFNRKAISLQRLEATEETLTCTGD